MIRAYDNSYRNTLICVDSYCNRVPKGRIYNPYLENGVEFTGVIELLDNIEKLLLELQAPQEFSVRRAFRVNDEIKTQLYTCDNVKVGKIATFSLVVLFRQNASWQGSVAWHEGRTEESFRSVLEFLMLMDSAMMTCDEM